MSRALVRLQALLLVVAAMIGPALADDSPADHPAPHLVGIVEVPPFALKDAGGGWDGIAVRLWRHVANDLGIEYRFQEMAPPDLLAAIQAGRLTAVVTAAASAERERLIDFSHPYYSTGLGIAVPATASSPDWLTVAGNLLSWSFLELIGLLVLVLMAVGAIVWLCERRANPEHFSANPLKGIADGLWWAAVTMTTVGYGDKAPRTQAGRFLGGIWMFAALILISCFTAHITSTLTISSLSGRVRGPADLPHVRVGTLQGSAVQPQLRSGLGIAAGGYDSIVGGLEALARGDIDAFVFGEPILRYEVANHFHGRLQVLPTTFMRQDFAFALPPNSPLRKPINESLLGYIITDEWQSILRTYLGPEKQ